MVAQYAPGQAERTAPSPDHNSSEPVMFDQPTFDQHERMVFVHDAEIHRIPVRLRKIFARSGAANRSASELADERTRQLLAEAR